jgi:ribose transport system ATP-binding protein
MTASPGSQPPLLRLSDVTKRFGETQALAGVSLDFRPGDVHCLMGANGSGKSTLAKIIAGFHHPDQGVAEVRGEPVAWPLAGHRGGGLAIAVVHQDRALAQGLSVADNLFVYRPMMRWHGAAVSRRGERREAARVLAQFGLSVDPRVPVGSLSPAEQTVVEIVRAIEFLRARPRGSGALMLLDEPTAALSARESARVLDVIRQLSADDVAVLFVSHRLEEALEVGTTYTVLRNGRVVGSGTMSATDGPRLVALMAGDTAAVPARAPAAAGRPEATVILDVTGLSGHRVRNVSFTLRGGEILGLTGLSGAGNDEVIELLFGAQRPRAGSITVNGRKVWPTSPRVALSAGLAYLPPDRRRRGAVGAATIRENLTIPFARRLTKAGHLLRGRERALADARIRKLGVTGGTSETPIGALSGGNQQKVLLGRWLEFDPAVYLLTNPTEGVDIGTRAAVYGVLRDLVKSGRGVLVSTGDLEELATVCDRVLVFADGRLAGEATGAELNRERLVRLVEQVDAAVPVPATAAEEPR